MDAMDSDRSIDKTSIPQIRLTGFGGTVATVLDSTISTTKLNVRKVSVKT